MTRIVKIFFLAIGAILVVISAGCSRKPPVRIGFLGGLTGRVADLGVAGRDGALLAIEEANASGGIGGRRVELIVRDDRQDPETARQAMMELAREGVVAVIGPMTSAMAMAALPVTTDRQVLMISPTVSTNDLSGRDDLFLRVYPASRQVSIHLASHIREARGIRRMAALYDLGNRAYTESMFAAFRDAYSALGGSVVLERTFTSGPGTTFLDMVRDVTTSRAEGLLVIANAMDTAMICQQLPKVSRGLPVFTGEWSVTEEILHFGGAAVEGIEFFHTFDKTSKGESFLRFRDAFRERFGYDAGFAQTHAYDAARVLLQNLDDHPSAAGLKKTILETSTYEGVQGPFSFDRFGDVVRNHILMTVRDGRFETAN